MGGLASYLQAEFAGRLPEGWRCRHEIPLLPVDLERLIGYAPRADVILERTDASRRLWIEFEVSRADPVANHAKFATAHLFTQQRPTEAFVSMVSAHVARGRRNLATNMIYVMRTLGMRAFQTTLLPHLAAKEVQRLNSISREALRGEQIPVEAEIERAIAITEPVSGYRDSNIYLAGEPVQALLNLRQWNNEIRTANCRAMWGRRTVKYFVADSCSGEFAPSKFCAYVPAYVGQTGHGAYFRPPTTMTMTIPLYCAVDSTNRLDGTRAWVHLTRHLAMIPATRGTWPDLDNRLHEWLDRHADAIAVHPSGPVLLLPPDWL
jgi:hypothetical protein